MIQWGTKQTTGASTYTITFDQEFGYTPQVVLSQGSGGSAEGTWVGAIKLTGYTAYGRGFTFQAYQSETMYVNWLAIGGYGTY